MCFVQQVEEIKQNLKLRILLCNGLLISCQIFQLDQTDKFAYNYHGSAVPNLFKYNKRPNECTAYL